MSTATMPDRVEGFSVVLFVFAVLLLVVMPGCIYLIGWGVQRLSKASPSRRAVRDSRKVLLDRADGAETKGAKP